jgi:hypothetical protein
MSMELYNAVRAVPQTAIKPIRGGRLSGMSDINPMWRIQTLTEQFGMCGFGWKYEITDRKIVDGANEEKACFVSINLYVKVGAEWSAAIPGIGGSAFVAKEKGGLYTSDEAEKMALTDAISVACKALGFGADVYWANGRTKYTAQNPQEAPQQAKAKEPAPAAQAPQQQPAGAKKDRPPVCEICGREIGEMVNGKGVTYPPEKVAQASLKNYGKILCGACRAAIDKQKK